MTEQEAIELGKHAIAFAKTFTPQWISVGDRLPEDGVGVLVCDNFLPEINSLGENMNLSVASIYNGEWEDYNGDAHTYADNITHWMPLPEPPKQ